MIFNESHENEDRILDIVVSKCFDGAIIASTGGNEDEIMKINDSKIPVVLVDRDVCNKDENTVIDTVVNENFEGSYKLVSYNFSRS